MERKNISLDEPVYDRLVKHGKYGDSMTDIITKILDQVEGVAKK